MKSSALSLLVLLSLGPVPALAGPPTSSDAYGSLLEDVESEKDYDRVLHLLETALKQPINLLAADRDQLASLPWVSPYLADEIIKLRARGGLKALDDIKQIPGVNDLLIENLRPFVVVRPIEKRLPPVRNLLRLRVGASPPTSSFRKLKTYGMYEIEGEGISAGTAIDKDAGESRLNDFQSYYVRKTWARASLTAGDFLLTSGHGLLFSAGSGESPSTADPWRLGRGSFGIKTSTSSQGNSLFRGVGLNVKGGAFEVCAAASRANFDVRLDQDGRVVGFNETGSHVTSSEIKGRAALRENLAAAACRYTAGNLALTASLAGFALSRDVEVAAIDWPGHRTRLAGSLDLSVRQGGGLVFAEGALLKAGGAFIGGLAVDRPQAEALVLARAYGKQYLSLHAAPFAFYSGLGAGEQGLFTLIKFKPVAGGQMSIGNDLHKKTGTDASGESGSETFVDLTMSSGAFEFGLGEKLARSEEPPSSDEATSPESTLTGETTRLRSRVQLGYSPSRDLSLRLRYEVLTASQAAAGATARSTSDIMRLDLSLDTFKPLKLDAGFYAFSVDDWAARIYQYEAGVPYYPSFELLKSDGSRWYAVVSLNAKSVGTFAAKYGRTLYDDGEERSEFLATFILRM